MTSRTLRFAEKRVVVTGGAGFLGARVVAAMRGRGYQDVFVPRRRHYDLVQPDGVERLLDEHPADLLVHIAAVVGGIGANREMPGRFFYDNLMMGAQLVEQARRRGVEKLVAIGTICAYPKHTTVPFSEDDLWNGYPEETNAPYGLAKKMLLVQAQAYRQQYGLNTIYLLPTNLYGPGDNYDPGSSHVIPALIRKCAEAKDRGARSVEVWGTGSVTREFLYVDDAAEAIVDAGEHYDEAAPINIGSGHEISIKAVAELIAELVGFDGELTWDPTRPDGQPRRGVDSRRARDTFGFEPRTTFRDGLVNTIAWYREHIHGRSDY